MGLEVSKRPFNVLRKTFGQLNTLMESLILGVNQSGIAIHQRHMGLWPELNGLAFLSPTHWPELRPVKTHNTACHTPAPCRGHVYLLCQNIFGCFETVLDGFFLPPF
jgi:hypothetical protein